MSIYIKNSRVFCFWIEYVKLISRHSNEFYEEEATELEN